jgi:hypothetical protein
MSDPDTLLVLLVALWLLLDTAERYSRRNHPPEPPEPKPPCGCGCGCQSDPSRITVEPLEPAVAPPSKVQVLCVRKGEHSYLIKALDTQRDAICVALARWVQHPDLNLTPADAAVILRAFDDRTPNSFTSLSCDTDDKEDPQ